MAPRNSSGSLGWRGFPGDGDGRGPSLCPAGPNLGLLMNHISLMEVTAVFPCLGLCLSMIPTPAMGWCSGRSTNSLSGHITPEHSSCPKMLSPPFKTQTSLGIQKKTTNTLDISLENASNTAPRGAVGTEPCPSTSKQPELVGALHNNDPVTLEVFSNLKDSLIN